MNIEGPIMHAFASHFLVVGPSGGNPHELQGWRAIATRLNERWRAEYFCGLFMRDDWQVSKADIENANLVLIGTPENNKILNDLWSRLPIQVSVGGIHFGSRSYAGPVVGIEFIYPNPSNPQRYVVVLTANEASAFDHHELQLSQSGWYDYGIWQVTNGAEGMLERNWFDGSWQQPEAQSDRREATPRRASSGAIP
jgi:hypothetical protein